MTLRNSALGVTISSNATDFSHSQKSKLEFICCLYVRRRKRPTCGFNQRHTNQVETPLNLYLGFRLYTERCKDLITVINNLHPCSSYQRIKALSNELGNVVIEAFETHQAAIGTKSSLGKFTTCAFDNIDHNSSSSAAYGSFHGSAVSITQHFDETCSDSDKLMNLVIKKETPKQWWP